jgi:cob(I)alamin adenosyltransferase
MTGSSTTLSIGELAERSGVTVRALRHYDDIGLLEPAHRTPGGHRRYGTDQVDTLLRIVTLRSFGVGLSDIAGVLVDDASSARILHDQLQRIRSQRAELARLESALEQHLAGGAAPPTEDPNRLTTTLEITRMTIRLDRITTRRGDDGTTSIADRPNVPKTSPRIDAIGTVDELNAHVGLAVDAATEPTMHAALLALQHQLFDLGADLATVDPPADGRRIGADDIESLETILAHTLEELEPLDSFVLPGGTGAGGALHVARTVCRRAERAVLAIEEETGDAARFLNRLSDVLFVLARSANRGSERLWVPAGAQRSEE